MSIHFSCSVCDHSMRAPDDAGGGRGHCPNCNEKIAIPFASPALKGSTVAKRPEPVVSTRKTAYAGIPLLGWIIICLGAVTSLGAIAIGMPKSIDSETELAPAPVVSKSEARPASASTAPNEPAPAIASIVPTDRPVKVSPPSDTTSDAPDVSTKQSEEVEIASAWKRRKAQETALRETEASAEKKDVQEKPLFESDQAAAAPRSRGGPVNVSGYTRKNGKYVAPYTRAAPGTGAGRRR